MTANATLPQSLFPVDLIQSEALRDLRRSDLVVLARITGLCGWQARKGKKGHPYAIPGQKWLGQACGIRRETASRAVCRLERLGFLVKIRRRRVAGRWQTNLYKVGAALWRALRRPQEALTAELHRVTSRSHIVPKRISKSSQNEREQRPRQVSHHIAHLKSILDGG